MKIISEHKKPYRRTSERYGYPVTPPKPGMKRVMAVKDGVTVHVDVPK